MERGSISDGLLNPQLGHVVEYPKVLLCENHTVLPRDVQTASANHPDGKRYWYFSDSLVTLGRLVVQPRPAGQSQIVSEFAEGDPDPTRNAQRAAIFRVVTDNVFRLFDEKTQS